MDYAALREWHTLWTSAGTRFTWRIPMSERRQSDGKELKKDQQVRREVLSEIGSEIAQEWTGAAYRNPNRDQARGDLGRSGHRVYEEHSGDDRTEGAGLRPITEENG